VNAAGSSDCMFTCTSVLVLSARADFRDAKLLRKKGVLMTDVFFLFYGHVLTSSWDRTNVDAVEAAGAKAQFIGYYCF
ncbi:hypothetical protein ACJX0J_014240, partial [Zea mays]